MKKRLISILAAMALLSSSMVPVMAEDTITVGGELLYSQDFEGDVEAEMLTNINGTGASAATFTVVNDEDDKALFINGNSKYGYNHFGAEYTDAVVKMDFKQVGASGSNGAWLGLGVRAVRIQGGAYYGNAGGYFDVIRYDAETKLYNKEAEQVRDRLGIVTAKGADYGKFALIDAFSDKATGMLNTEQIFSEAALKVAERNTKETLRMQNTISGSTVTSELKTFDGQIIDKLSAEVTPFGEKGVSQLLAHSGAYIIDDIKVMAPKTISTFFANAAEDEVMLGEETEFKLSCEDDTALEPDVARYEYDKKAVYVDSAKGTVAPLKLGTHTVKVFIDDINSDNYLEKSFTVTGVKAEAKLEAVVENPNPAFGEGTKINVYYGGKDVTDDADISGASYADGVVTPESVGVTEVMVSYEGQTVIVPLAVNNTEETIGEQEKTPVFTEDFEGNATELTALYSDNAKVTVTSSPDNADNGALAFTAAGTARSLPFGPENLTDYVLEYDFYYPTAGGKSSFIGSTMRTNIKAGAASGYNVGYFPSAEAGKVTSDAIARQVSIGYSAGSNDLSKWIYTGASNVATDASDMAKPWNTQKTIINNGNITTELYNFNDAFVMSYSTTLDELNTKAGADGFTSGRNVLRVHASYNVYFDNIKIYHINRYNDINVSVADGKITVTGTDNGALSGTVSTKAYGAADANGSYIAEGNGIGYVVVTYEDASGNEKNKVIKTGTLAIGGAEEFTVVYGDYDYGAMLFNQESDELDALEDGRPVFAKATVKRGALEGNGVMMAVCLYDGDTDALMNVYTASADAVQRVGDNIELYTKFVLPEGAENMYVRVFLWDSNMKALTEEFFEI